MALRIRPWGGSVGSAAAHTCPGSFIKAMEVGVNCNADFIDGALVLFATGLGW